MTGHLSWQDHAQQAAALAGKNYRDPAGWTTVECRTWRQVAVAAPMGETKSLGKLATEMSVAAKDCYTVSMVAISRAAILR
jgi:hypothetical protein